MKLCGNCKHYRKNIKLKHLDGTPTWSGPWCRLKVLAAKKNNPVDGKLTLGDLSAAFCEVANPGDTDCPGFVQEPGKQIEIETGDVVDFPD